MAISREELKKGLKHGDQLKIAAMLPGKLRYNQILVYNVFGGRSKALRGKGKRVLELAEIIIEHNKQLEKLLYTPPAKMDEKP